MKVFLVILGLIGYAYAQCAQTTASGTKAPANFCAGDLIFNENFDTFDMETWQHEINLAGGRNWEFQWYTNNRSNSFTRDGSLFVVPTLTAEVLGEAALGSALLNIHGGTPADQCTDPGAWGCERQGAPNNLLNPLRSARLRSVESFNFRYGRVEVRARMPAGDWIWPAIWLMPKIHAYGGWPASGEIDLVESRGNRDLVAGGVNIGAQQVGQTLHFGPSWDLNGWGYAHSNYNNAGGFHTGFHLFQMEWTPTELTFKVDDVVNGVHRGPFFLLGRFEEVVDWATDPWIKTAYNYQMAPFDQEFYFIINNAVGGVAFFPDGVDNPGGKPWLNTSPQATTDFWNGRNQWIPTWNMDNDRDRALEVDYIRVWAI